MTMETAFIAAFVAVLTLSLPYMWRIVQGPTVFDRVQALNGVGTKVPVLLVLTGLIFDRLTMFVDLALALFLLNLFGTLLIAKYMRLRAQSAEEGA